MSDHHHDHDDHHGCGCHEQSKRARKRAKNTHVAGANCCSSSKNVYTKCRRRKHCC